VHQRGHKRRALARVPLTAAVRINQRWSLELMRDTLAGRGKFRLLHIVGDFRRESPVIKVATALPVQRMVRMLE
jgi:putative transposase